ncbi:MAG: hypothetical protein JXA54_13600 [Candidatus Heimdallarchaeota archaeon]|nr:hypothetical protein [Candidatus Heimdallarchaeota archaeon]
MTTVLECLQTPDTFDGELLYHKEKKVRGNSFSIYSNNTIMLQGKVSKNRTTTIPADIFRWISITKDNFTTNVKYKSLSQQMEFTKGLVRVRRNIYGCSLQLLEKYQINPGETLQYFLQLNENLKPTSNYQNAVKLLEIPLLYVDTFEQLFIGGKKRRKFKIFRDENAIIYVKAQGVLKSGGSVSLSGRLTHYLRDWFEKEQLVIASKNGEEPLILETRVIRKNSSRKPEKCLYFPYYGRSRPITCIFASPDFQLTEQVLKDLKVKQTLQKYGIPLVKFTSHLIMSNDHCDKQFEYTVRNIVQQFATTNYWGYFPEVQLKFALPKEHALGNKKVVDIILAKNKQPSLLLMEIKTSEKTLSSELEWAIADILHTANKFKKQCNLFPFLFINQDITRVNDLVILTEQFGLSCGILLLGQEKIAELKKEPEIINQLIQDFTKKQALLSSGEGRLIHPLTSEVTTNEQLHSEALLLLLHSSKNALTENIARYSLLMNISITDFWLLYDHFKGAVEEPHEEDEEDTVGILASPSMTPLIPSIVQTLHDFLTTKASFGLLELKFQKNHNQNMAVLLQHQQILQARLPPCVKVHDVKKRKKGQGFAYEQDIRERLLSLGFQVASNVIFLHMSKSFEVDHLAFKAGELVLISCKDRSDISYEPDLPHLIKEAANSLEFRKTLLRADKALLYIKVNPQYCTHQQTLFGTTPWVEDITIVIE